MVWRLQPHAPRLQPCATRLQPQAATLLPYVSRSHMMVPPHATERCGAYSDPYSAAGDGRGVACGSYGAYGTDYTRSVHQLAAGIAASGSRGA